MNKKHMVPLILLIFVGLFALLRTGEYGVDYLLGDKDGVLTTPGLSIILHGSYYVLIIVPLTLLGFKIFQFLFVVKHTSITLPTQGRFDAVEIFVYVLVFVLTFTLTLKQSEKGDLASHITWASAINFYDPVASFTKLTYPIWHICLTVLNRIFRISLSYGAALTSAFFNLLTVIIVRKIVMSFLKEKIRSWWADCIALMLTFVTPIYMPWFNHSLYLGQWSPTIWHNPTNNAVKPFALVICYLFIATYAPYGSNSVLQNRIQKKDEYKQIFFLTIFLLASVFAKPSFIQIFLPSVILFLFIELIMSRKKIISFYVKTAIILLPGIAGFLAQYVLVFLYKTTALSRGITFTFFAVWRLYSPNIIWSVLLALAFPLWTLLLDYKNILRNKMVLFACILLLVSIGEFGFLADTIDGRLSETGDFGWGYMLALFVIWVVTTIRFFDVYSRYDILQLQHKRITFTIGFSLLFLHFFCGIYYYIYLLFFAEGYL